jgi:predicted protein tyrosine phosphatase
VFAESPGVEVDSAGLSNDAVTPLTVEQVLWADIILVMERAHLARLNSRFGRHLKGRKVGVLNIPDRYEFMDAELVALLKARCAPFIPLS